jgi:phosphinothricin acetyltransferase
LTICLGFGKLGFEKLDAREPNSVGGRRMSEAIRIRPVTAADAEAIAAIYAPFVENTAITFEFTPPDADEMRRRIAATTLVYPWLVAEVGGRVAGYAYAGRHSARAAYDWSADVSVYLHPEFHRRGVGRRLYRSLVAVLRAQGFHALFAVITLPNAASVALHRSLGFSDVGACREAGYKLGEWRDVFLMGAILADRSVPPPALTPIPELGDYERLLNGV